MPFSKLEEEVLKALKEEPRRATEIKDYLAKEGIKVQQGEVIRALLSLRRRGLIERIQDETFDETRPWSTAKWHLKELPAKAKLPTTGFTIALSGALIRDVGVNLGIETLSLFEALEEVLCSASKRLCIAVPYIGPALTGLLSNYRNHIKSIYEILVLTEFKPKGVTTLERLRATLFPQLKYKLIGRYLTVSYGGEETKPKVRGMHLKLIIADSSIALIGSFNLTEVHFLSNYDLAIVVRGEFAKVLERLFMMMWERAQEPIRRV